MEGDARGTGDPFGLNPTDAVTEAPGSPFSPGRPPAIAVLNPLHDHGVRISIDDFGTGYTSLALLPELPLDELRVDQRFVMRSATTSFRGSRSHARCRNKRC